MSEGFWDQEIEVGSVGKNQKGDEIKIKLVSKNNREFVDVRTWYMKDGELKPGKGISIPVDSADAVAELIMEASSKQLKAAR